MKDYIEVKWYVGDVLEVEPNLTNEQAMTVLKTALAHHDASVGINYEVLESIIDDLFGDING